MAGPENPQRLLPRPGHLPSQETRGRAIGRPTTRSRVPFVRVRTPQGPPGRTSVSKATSLGGSRSFPVQRAEANNAATPIQDLPQIFGPRSRMSRIRQPSMPEKTPIAPKVEVNPEGGVNPDLLVNRCPGADPKVLRAFLLITLDRFGHLLPGNEDEAAGLLDAWLDRQAVAPVLRESGGARCGFQQSAVELRLTLLPCS